MTPVRAVAAVFVAVAGAVAGCSSSPPRGAGLFRPAVLPPEFADAASKEGDALTQRGPVRVDLPTVLRLARDRSLDVALVRERLAEARGRELSAVQRLFPWVTVGARFVVHDGDTQATEGEFVNVDKQNAFLGVGPALQWEPGEAAFAILAARQRTEAGRAASDAAEAGAAVQAGEAYLDLVRAGAALSVAEQASSVAGSLLAETEARVSAGSGFRGDVLRASSQAAIIAWISPLLKLGVRTFSRMCFHRPACQTPLSCSFTAR